MAVEPFEALAVEHGTALLDVLDVETGRELVERQDLLLAPGGPAKEREVVDERLTDEALADVVVDRRLALPLAHLGAVGVEDERQVGEHRFVVAEGTEQEDVLRRVGQVVLAADDVADLHRGVVHDHREVVERRAVAADDDEVATERRRVDGDVATDEVVELDEALGDAKAERRAPALGLERRPFGGRQVCAAAVVTGRQMGRFLPLSLDIELLGGAVAGVGHVGFLEPLRRGRVERQPLHLAVRGVWATGGLTGDLGTLVPDESQPMEPVQDVLLVGDRAPGDVRVLEPEDECAAVTPREEEIEEGRPRSPDVKRAGRTRGDADSDLRMGGWFRHRPGT